VPEPLDPEAFDDRNAIQVQWDTVEQTMRDYLSHLSEADLAAKPFPEGEDENLIVWQVLLHLINHGTDHRAQLLRQIADLGYRTPPQDFIFYVYDHP
jgi:uncharacterized damage-inducible protein DinB